MDFQKLVDSIPKSSNVHVQHWDADEMGDFTIVDLSIQVFNHKMKQIKLNARLERVEGTSLVKMIFYEKAFFHYDFDTKLVSVDSYVKCTNPKEYNLLMRCFNQMCNKFIIVGDTMPCYTFDLDIINRAVSYGLFMMINYRNRTLVSGLTHLALETDRSNCHQDMLL